MTMTPPMFLAIVKAWRDLRTTPIDTTPIDGPLKRHLDYLESVESCGGRYGDRWWFYYEKGPFVIHLLKRAAAHADNPRTRRAILRRLARVSPVDAVAAI